MIETPDVAQKYQKPAPMPDAGQRAVTLSVTDFDRLMADPFAFYANKILNLRPLESVAAQPSYAWRGSVVHDILEHWVNEDDCDPEKLNQRAADLLSNQAVHPALRALWQPRIAEGLRWIAQQTQEMRADGRGVLVAEVKGKTEIDGVKIIGRVDRIDRLPDGRLAIIDYKTGSSPTDAKVLAGFALQLGLIGLIAEDGGIKGAEGEAGAFEYWSLAKKYSNFGNISTPVTDIGRAGKKPAEEFVDFAREYASQAIQRWILGSEPFYAKLHPEYAPYADYDQLMRYEEWNGREPLPVAARQDEAGQ
jgi:ATP-dependent helicase/nuclease subunit B